MRAVARGRRVGSRQTQSQPGPMQKWGVCSAPGVPGATAQALRHGGTTDWLSLTLKVMCTGSHRVRPSVVTPPHGCVYAAPSGLG